METDRLAALIADLDHPDKAILRRAVDELIARAAVAPEIRALLERRLDEADHRHSWAAAYVLGHLPEVSDATVRALILALDHAEGDIRWACALLLTEIGRADPSVQARLIELCGGGSAKQKRMALYSLRDLGLQDDESLQAMFEALFDANPTVRVAAAISLKTRRDRHELVRAALLRSYLNDEDFRVRSAAAITLAQLGSPSATFLTELTRDLESDNVQVRKTAAVALRWLEKK